MKKLWFITLILAVPAAALAQDPEAGETVAPSAQAEAVAAEPSAAEPAAAPDVATPDEAAAAAEDDDDKEEYDTRYPNKKYIDAVLARSKHQSLGYALGRQGDGFVVGVRFDQPVTKKHWGYLQFFHYTNFGPFKSPLDPVLMFGMNFITHTDLIMGMFRLYGGGGFHVGFRPSPACENPVDSSDIALAYTQEGVGPSLLEPAAMTNSPDLQRVANRIADLKQKCEDQKDPFGISGGGTGGIEFFSSPMRAYFIEISGGGGTQKSGLWSDSGLILRAGNQFYF